MPKPSALPDPEALKTGKRTQPCCQEPVKEYLDKYAKLRREGHKMEGYRVVSATLLSHGFEISAWQIGLHVREHCG